MTYYCSRDARKQQDEPSSLGSALPGGIRERLRGVSCFETTRPVAADREIPILRENRDWAVVVNSQNPKLRT
jgi:hypothetical protein